jgi:Glycosyltransferase sugar-binding region containing DXD motif
MNGPGLVSCRIRWLCCTLILVLCLCWQTILLNSTLQSISPVATHLHAIPNNLIFTYNNNLLQTWIRTRQLVPRTILGLYRLGFQIFPNSWIPSLQDLVSEKQIFLRRNVRNVISMYKPQRVYFLNDPDCIGLLREYYREFAAIMQPKFLLEKGMIRGDICRGLALYKYGGLYMDVDIESRVVVWPLLPVGTSFASVWEHGSQDIFQSFLAATPRHPIIQRYLDLFRIYYQGKLRDTINHKKGVVLLRMAYDQVTSQSNATWRSTLQMWNETLYNPNFNDNVGLAQEHQHRQGGGGLCNYLVIDSRGNVPFWSHTPGSSAHCQARDH